MRDTTTKRLPMVATRRPSSSHDKPSICEHSTKYDNTIKMHLTMFLTSLVSSSLIDP